MKHFKPFGDTILTLKFSRVFSLETIISTPLLKTKPLDTFTNSLLSFLNVHQLDGVDIDWEFPVFSTGRLEERKQFIDLLFHIKKKCLDEQVKSKTKKILSAAVGADFTICESSYDVQRMIPLVDFVNVMTYDLTHWNWFWRSFGLASPATMHHFSEDALVKFNRPQSF